MSSCDIFGATFLLNKNRAEAQIEGQVILALLQSSEMIFFLPQVEAVSFNLDWKQPCVLMYTRSDLEDIHTAQCKEKFVKLGFILRITGLNFQPTRASLLL